MKPLAITMGCPVGIGPEIILKYFASKPAFPAGMTPVVVGDPKILSRCSESLNIPATISLWTPGERLKNGVVSVFAPENLPALDPDCLGWGKPDVQTGKAMAGYIETAVSLIQAGQCSGMVTCPITKKALNEAGYNFPGHTEMLASLCQTDDYAMMMAGEKLRVTLVTIHTPLGRVPAVLSSDKIFHLIEMTALSLKNDFGISAPCLAVAALNPHAGEDGLFGDEEDRLIRPAIQQATEASIDVSGPFPPDTVFYKAAAGNYDAVVCMYHDQGLIPFKLLHFADGVNVTIGLPIVRTSVDHGTAYDIAGQGKADPSSLAAAVAMAGEIAANRLQ
ncbi:MAG: 4-hydroxythreonine-4-phosphate dehydrogenase PdxA [Desulfobulbaceae bacterium]|nr:4-hydroxythreonine-4-phosphate dehydrogenase PdxA [Desulfobulbaceae bacterium]